MARATLPSTDQFDWSLHFGFTHIYAKITSDVRYITCEIFMMAHMNSERIDLDRKLA